MAESFTRLCEALSLSVGAVPLPRSRTVTALPPLCIQRNVRREPRQRL